MRYLILPLLATTFAFAQAPKPDAKGCKDPSILTRMSGCYIARCLVNDYNVQKMQVSKAPDPSKFKDVEGTYEKVHYTCMSGTSGLQSFRNVENALKAKGYQIIWTDTYGTTRYYMTARQGPQWVKFDSDGPEYEVVAVREKQMEQQIQANSAAGWSEQINQTGRASIYGINFDTAKATIRPDSETVLGELLGLLQKQPDSSFVVAGHTDNVGTDAVNVPLSRQRAESVIAWLTAKGVDRARLVPAGFGAKRPLVDNGTEDGRAKNRRVDLVKLY